MYADFERRQAIIDLMAMPDSPDLHRGHRLTLEGRLDRYQLVRDLAAAFVQSKLLELHDPWEPDASYDFGAEVEGS